VPDEHVENADTRQASISLTNEPPPLDPLENEIGAERKAMFEIGCFRFCPIPLKKSSFEVIGAASIGKGGRAGNRRVPSDR
jgi:hypothetical protein